MPIKRILFNVCVCVTVMIKERGHECEKEWEAQEEELKWGDR